MGTRCHTLVYNEAETPIVCLYRQFDGYPDGHGIELSEFLKDMKVVNGIRWGEETEKIANGMGCLAAQLIAHFKKVPGGFYINKIEADNEGWSDYFYHIHQNVIEVKARNNKTLFRGPWDSFRNFCLEYNP